jgi:hypothetical protein
MEQDGKNAKLANLLLAAECMGEVRNRRAIRQTDELVRSQLMEKAIRYDAPYYYQPHNEYEECGATREKAVRLPAGLWKKEQTRLWLRSAAEGDRDWIVRRVAVRELAQGWKEDAETLPLLKDRARSDESYGVRTAATRELARGWKEDAETLPFLKDRARSDGGAFVRIAAVRELARGWKEDPEVREMLDRRGGLRR